MMKKIFKFITDQIAYIGWMYLISILVSETSNMSIDYAFKSLLFMWFLSMMVVLMMKGLMKLFGVELW